MKVVSTWVIKWATALCSFCRRCHLIKLSIPILALENLVCGFWDRNNKTVWIFFKLCT